MNRPENKFVGSRELTMKFMIVVVSIMATVYIAIGGFCIAAIFLPSDPAKINFVNGYSALLIPAIIGAIAGFKLHHYLFNKFKHIW